MTSLAFGIGHGNGYPPGWPGALLAGAWGMGLGLLRRRSGGLAAPIVAHFFADATIASIVVAW